MHTAQNLAALLFLVARRCANAAPVSAIEISLSSPQAELVAGASIRVSFSAQLTDAANASAARLVPYFDGAQFGAEVGFSAFTGGVASGSAFVPLSWSAVPARSLQLAFVPGWPFDGPTMGSAPPAGAVLSNTLALAVVPRKPARPTLGAGAAQLTVYFETWFTPYNFYWQSYNGGPYGAGMAEAIPSIGRYASVSLEGIRHQAAQFVQAGVDALVVDWTNNCWLPGCDAWEHRSLGIRELINATDLAFGIYAGLRASEGWAVPKFIILLGLDNGPTTPLPALYAELDYIATAYLANATAGGADSFVMLEGRPLVLIFDGTGAPHPGFAHDNFTIRWMASQLQNTPDFAKRGIWSWMDGSLAPLVVMSADNASRPEAATLAPAFFAGGGWLNSGLAVGRSGGLTLFSELAAVLGALGGCNAGASFFLNLCQWNEYAGTPEGPAGTSYEDSYSPDLSNDLEPTSPWAPAYQRPGKVRTGGGYGYRALNSLALVRALLADTAAADGSAALFVISPAAGDLSNYTAAHTVRVSWIAARFDSEGLGGLLANVSLPVSIAVDGAVVASLPAPGDSGPQSFDLNVGALDARFPHVLTVQALPGTEPGAHLTRWPQSFDFVDADVGTGVPLAVPVPATASAWIWLPETQQSAA
jgi:hypothetical protein